MRFAATIVALLLLTVPAAAKERFPAALADAVASFNRLLDEGDAAAALRLAEETLAGARATYGAESPEAAVILSTVARAQQELGRIDAAESAYLEVITLLESLSDREYRADLAFESAWRALAQIYEKQGQPRKSIAARKEHLKLLDAKSNANDAFSTVLDWMKIGDLHLNLGEYQAAGDAYREGVGVVPFVPNQIRSVPLFIHRRLAFIYRLEERYSKSEAVLLDGVEQMESIDGGNSQETVLFYEALGLTYYHQSRHEEAERMADKALRFYKKAGLTESGDSVRAMVLKARLLSEPAYKSPTNRSERALKLLNAALEIRKSESGDRSLPYANVLSFLALHHLKQHAFGEAEQVSRQALAIYEDKFGRAARITGEAQHSLAQALEGQKRYAEALPLAEQAHAVQREALPPYHRTLGDTLSLLSELYKKLGRQDDYLAVRRKIAAFYEERARFMSGG